MTLTLESLRKTMQQLQEAPKIPLSINFASGLDRSCALEAWQAKVKEPASASLFQGVPLKVSPSLPDNVMMFVYADKMSFFNFETGLRWSVPVKTLDFMKPLKMRQI